MKKVLTQEQVKKLFALCEKYEVYDYDVQIEIVDHLASAIENKWEQNPKLGFGWALKQSFNNLDWRAFRKLESRLSRQMRLKFSRLLWKYFIEYFKLPKILISISLTLFFFITLQLLDKNTVLFFSLAAIFALLALAYNYFYFPNKIEVKPVDGKSFMLLEYLKERSLRVGVFIQLPFWVSLYHNASDYTNQLAFELGTSVFLALSIVLFYGYFVIMPEKIREYFFTHYREYAQ